MKNIIIILVLLLSTNLLFSQEVDKTNTNQNIKLIKKESSNTKKQVKAPQKEIKTPVLRTAPANKIPKRDTTAKHQQVVSPLMRTKNN